MYILPNASNTPGASFVGKKSSVGYPRKEIFKILKLIFLQKH